MAHKVWWCDNCGYEVDKGGRCAGCGERLLLSDLPELLPGSGAEEVGYRLGGWEGRARGRLIEALVSQGVLHRFEDEELIVLLADESTVDRAVAESLTKPASVRRQKTLGAEGLSVPLPDDPSQMSSPWPESRPLQGAWEDQFGRIVPFRRPSWWRRNKRTSLAAGGTLVGLVVLIAVIGAVRGGSGGSGGSSSAGGLSAGQLQRSLLSDLHKTGSDGFDEPAAKSVTCIMPSEWIAGQTFTCYAYGTPQDNSAPELGTLSITVLPAQGDNFEWNVTWDPAL